MARGHHQRGVSGPDLQAHAGSQRLHLLGPGQQARRNIDVAGADLEQQLEQIGDQRGALCHFSAYRRLHR